MIDLYYAPTPNTWKVSILLEECGLPYRVIPVDIMAGEQSKPEFPAVNPNGRVPAIVDNDGSDGPGLGRAPGMHAWTLLAIVPARRYFSVKMRDRSPPGHLTGRLSLGIGRHSPQGERNDRTAAG